MNCNLKGTKMQKKQKREVRKMNAPFNKITVKGTVVEWTDSQKEAVSAFNEAAKGGVQWWIVQESGSATLHAAK